MAVIGVQMVLYTVVIDGKLLHISTTSKMFSAGFVGVVIVGVGHQILRLTAQARHGRVSV